MGIENKKLAISALKQEIAELEEESKEEIRLSKYQKNIGIINQNKLTSAEIIINELTDIIIKLENL